MKSFLIIDSSNMFHRSRHVTHGTIDTKLGMSLHIMFNSIKKMWNKFNCDHIIFAFEGKSWRKSVYQPYKANRSDKKAQLSPKELEEDKLFWETFNELQSFITNSTNCTVLQHPELEADDLIAGFINSHPDDMHIIISSDSDFYQLLADNVVQYNGISEKLMTTSGIFDKDGLPELDKVSQTPVPAPDPEWLLFEKCIRGDTSDNIFSAYPGVRKKGSKSKVGMLDAYNDRHDKGWAWNNIMNATWKDHNGLEHIVEQDYNRNKMLIDLNAQPDDIKIKIYETILNQSYPKKNSQVGIKLMKFCGLYDLTTIGEYASHYAVAFQTGYPYE